MSVNLVLSGHDPEPHRTDMGEDRAAWGAAVDWMLSLPPGKYPAVDAFAGGESDDGGETYTDTETLSNQLNDAALAHDPGDAGEMVKLFLDRLGGGYPDETVSVTTH